MEAQKQLIPLVLWAQWNPRFPKVGLRQRVHIVASFGQTEPSGFLTEYRSRKRSSVEQNHLRLWILWLLIFIHKREDLHNTLANPHTVITFNFTKWEHIFNLYQLVNKPQTSLQIHMLISQASDSDCDINNRRFAFAVLGEELSLMKANMATWLECHEYLSCNSTLLTGMWFHTVCTQVF